MLRTTPFAAGVALAVTAVLAVGAPAIASPAPVTLTGAATGYDVSYPQCGVALPTRGTLAIVGVNAGVGTTTNPCLAEQLAWGDAPAPDGTPQLADVYVNTADPGHLGGWWPSADATKDGAAVSNPEGTCVGAENPACAYVYGYSIASDDATKRGVTRVADRTWWLDVETVNSWSWDRSANRAVLEGMTDALAARGAEVGLYSAARQWSLIVGTTPASSPLAGLPSWIAGAVTEDGATANCASAALTPGGRVALAQWVADGFDHNRTCRPPVTGSTPTVVGTPRVGELLAVRTGPAAADGVRTTITWLRYGVAIPDATGAVYRPTAADVGTVIAVRVVRTRIGSPPQITMSPPLVVAAAPPTAAKAPTPSPTAPPATPAPESTPTVLLPV